MGAVAAIGEALPDFALPASDGRMRRLSEARGSGLLLNLWSAECPHSARADAEIASLRGAWGGKVLVWPIACNPSEAEEAIRSTAESRGMPFVLLDRDQSVTRLLGGITTPHFSLLDAEGILRYRGGLDDVSLRQRTPTRHYLAEAVEAVLAGHPPDPSETPSFGCAIVWKMEG
jgi:peroxiredoxin